MEARPNPFAGIEAYGAFFAPPEPDVIQVRRNNGQLLSFLRTDHIHDPRHGQLLMIVGAWDIFLNDTRLEDREIYAEGGIRPPDASPITTLAAKGEQALLSWFGKTYEVPIFSGDTEGGKEFASLLKQGFDPHHIMYYLHLRHVVQWHRSSWDQSMGNGDIALYMEKVRNRYTQLYKDFHPNNWNNFSFQETHKKLFGAQPWSDVFFAAEQTVHYWETNTVIQQVATAWNIERNDYLMNVLRDRFNKGKSIFVCFGWQHGYRLEKDLIALGDSYSIEKPEAPQKSFLFDKTPMFYRRPTGATLLPE